MARRIKMLASFALVSALLVLGWQATEAQMRVSSAKVAKSSARNYIKQRVPEKAFELLLKAVELSPDDPEANFMLGTFYADKEMLDEMNVHFENALSHKKGKKFYKKGMRLVGASDFLLGGIWYTRETLWTRYFNIGVRALNAAQFSDALTEFDMALKVDAERADTYKAVGKVYMQMDSLDIAVEHYRKALSMDSTLVEAHADIGVGYLNKQRYEEAIPNLQKAASFAPKNISISKALATAQWMFGDKEGAVKSAEAALEVNPDDGKVLALVGGIFTDMQNYDKAVEYLEKALEKNPDNSETIFNLANAYMGQDNLEKAEALFAKTLETNPDDFQALYQLGSIYDSSKKFDEAIDAFKKVVDLKPRFSRGWDALYKAYAHKSAVNEGEVAREAAKKAEEALNMATSLGGGQ
ncbi:MAG: tetratricopeptide repeat protein [Candidatus Latescibacterota bacterium]|nr:tetratricopeptide repeat protein [Candidatus Latescibacterota bacterium]